MREMVDGIDIQTKIGIPAVPAASPETGIVQVASFPILPLALLVSSAGLPKMEIALGLEDVLVEECVTCVLETGRARSASSITSHHVACATSVMLPVKVDALEEWMVVELVCVPETGSANSASSIISLHATSASSALPQSDVHSSPPLREHPGPK